MGLPREAERELDREDIATMPRLFTELQRLEETLDKGRKEKFTNNKFVQNKEAEQQKGKDNAGNSRRTCSAYIDQYDIFENHLKSCNIFNTFL